MTQLPKIYFHPITKEISYDLVLIPAGEYLMGSEEEEAFDSERPVHRVRITQDFYIGKYPITQAVWSAVMGGHNPSSFKGGQRPVENVSWQDIVSGDQDEELPISFLSMLGQNYPVDHPILNKWEFRLPTEAEWEYAARANSPYKYSGSGPLKQVGWFYQNSHNETKKVGLKLPNAFGIYDMSGNVREWCQDWFDFDYYKKCKEGGLIENPINDKKSDERVVRGGSWLSFPQRCRVSLRSSNDPTIRNVYLGFRLVLAPSSAD